MYRKYRKRNSLFANTLLSFHRSFFSKRSFIFNIYLPLLDWTRTFHSPKLRQLRKRLLEHLKAQRDNWPGSYTDSYFYQGLAEIGITGCKPTEFRFAQYQVDDLLKPEFSALDIGSNCGFVALYLAKRINRVVGIEINPYLNAIGTDAAACLGRNNVTFICDNFGTFDTPECFDVVLSLSNHHTIDGNLDLDFERYVRKVHDLMNDDGYLFFESHNVWGPGKGGPGDDGDMEKKFATLNHYFEIERWRMVECFLPPLDIDKLFIVAKKVHSPSQITFNLAQARDRYGY